MNEIIRSPAAWPFNRRSLLLGAGATAAYASLSSRPARAVVQIDVTQGNIQPLPIAIPDFLGSGSGAYSAALGSCCICSGPTTSRYGRCSPGANYSPCGSSASTSSRSGDCGSSCSSTGGSGQRAGSQAGEPQ